MYPGLHEHSFIEAVVRQPQDCVKVVECVRMSIDGEVSCGTLII